MNHAFEVQTQVVYPTVGDYHACTASCPKHSASAIEVALFRFRRHQTELFHLDTGWQPYTTLSATWVLPLTPAQALLVEGG